MTRTSNDPKDLTEAWLEQVVIGLDLCPFASGPWGAGRVRITVSPAGDFEAAVHAVATEIQHLVVTPESQLSSTLVVLPEALRDFDEFLDAAEVVLGLIEDSGADPIVQLAHFHPDYRFEGTAADDLGNYTNRAPFPTFHLLRPQEVERALESHGDGLAIPDANIRTLQGLGAAAVKKRWKKFTP